MSAAVERGKKVNEKYKDIKNDSFAPEKYKIKKFYASKKFSKKNHHPELNNLPSTTAIHPL
jgi:hypothetical protein